MNLPIYRGKKIDSDEYVEGSLIDLSIYGKYKIVELKNISGNDEHGIQRTNNWIDVTHIIDPSTLSIHFPDMTDSEGNKIFASLSEDGVGGTITETKDGKGVYKRVHMIDRDGMRCSRDLELLKSIKKYNSVLDLKVIGIKE